MSEPVDWGPIHREFTTAWIAEQRALRDAYRLGYERGMGDGLRLALRPPHTGRA